MITVEQVSMRFRMNQDHGKSLKEFAIAAAGRKLKYKDFWVFRDISFHIEKGQVTGIIGRNGAGKSTLLKIISGILTPTCGQVKLNGRVVPMLELGSGFDYELTGRENIFLNGSILGYSESFLMEKYDEIVAFSELEAFMETPIRNYSSGMMMRLAFSIATVVQPEILIVDEILSVGDEAFQKKSRRRMLELMGGGTTVLFVSHSMTQIREMCDSVIWLENGRLKMQGETKYVCDKYQESVSPASGFADRRHKASDADRNLSDVLFIYGEDETAYEWRVTAQREQLLAGAVPTNEICCKDIHKDIAKLYRTFICVRCSDSQEMRGFLAYAKQLHKTVLFDFSGCCDAENGQDPQEQLLEQAEPLCDAVIASNAALVSRYRNGGQVFYNPPAAGERLLEYASWAVYDRDILPYRSTDTMSEDELINYNRAAAQKKKRMEEGRRLGFFMDGMRAAGRNGTEREKSSGLQMILSAAAAYMGREPDARLLVEDTKDSVFLSEYPKLPKECVVQMTMHGQEDRMRGYAQADVILLAAAQADCQDSLLRAWMYASLVKVPCFCIAAPGIPMPQSMVHGENIWVCTRNESAGDELYEFLIQETQMHNIAKRAYAYVNEYHSCLQTGSRCGLFVRGFRQPNIAILASDPSGVRSREALHHAAVMLRQGYDVTLLVAGRNQDNLVHDGVVLPVVSRDIIYSYQYFDIMSGFDWESVKWMQNYRNVGRRIFFVQDHEPDDYQPGDMSRLQAVQMYQPHTPVEFVTACAGCQNWLREKYGQDAWLMDGTQEDIRKLYTGASNVCQTIQTSGASE